MDISVFNQTSYTDLSVFITDMINWFIGFAIIVTVVMIIVAGFRFITSMGDENKIQAATRSLLFTILGLILLFLAPTIVRFVLDNFLGGV